jgi:hypothetical protein
MSQSISSSWTESSPLYLINAPTVDSEEWIRAWSAVLARGDYGHVIFVPALLLNPWKILSTLE